MRSLKTHWQPNHTKSICKLTAPDGPPDCRAGDDAQAVAVATEGGADDRAVGGHGVMCTFSTAGMTSVTATLAGCNPRHHPAPGSPPLRFAGLLCQQRRK